MLRGQTSLLRGYVKKQVSVQLESAPLRHKLSNLMIPLPIGSNDNLNMVWYKIEIE